MEFILDKNKAIQLAKDMKLDVTFSSKTSSGVILKSGSRVEKLDFKSFFPELSDYASHLSFVTKDKGSIPSISRCIKIDLGKEKAPKIPIETAGIDFNTNSKGKWSMAS